MGVWAPPHARPILLVALQRLSFVQWYKLLHGMTTAARNPHADFWSAAARYMQAARL